MVLILQVLDDLPDQISCSGFLFFKNYFQYPTKRDNIIYRPFKLEKAKCERLIIKTSLLCISRDRTTINKAVVKTSDGEVVCSTYEMKMLGFYLNDQCTAERHVVEMEVKFHKKPWILRKLKKAGASYSDMIIAYKSMIRPVLEYASAAYHSILYTGQENRLEKLEIAVQSSEDYFWLG